MVFEPNYTRIVSSTRKKVGITQSVVEVRLPAGEEEIVEVFSVGARSTVIRNEVSGSNVTFTGLVDFQVMGKSVSGEIVAVDYTAEFKDNYTAKEEIRGELVISSSVVDVTGSVASNGVKIVAIVDILIDVIESEDVNVLTSINGDMEVLPNKITYMTFRGKATERFDVEEDIVINNTNRVYMVTPCVSIKSVNPRDNFAVVNGVVNLDICYGKLNEQNGIATHTHSIDFTWEVALDGMNEKSYIQSAVSILSNEIRVSTSLEENNANIKVLMPINYCGYVFNNVEIDVVDDVYSKTNYISITAEKVSTIEGRNALYFKDNISGTASISDTAPFIDEILSVCTNNIVLASSDVENGKLSIEGIANSTVVYYTKETDSLTSVQVEMPFMVEEKVEGDMSNIVTLCLDDVMAKSKRGKEIEVSAELCVYTDLYSYKNDVVISSVAQGDEKINDDCAMYIYVVKTGQSVWDVAKEMNVSEDLILEQNPDVVLPLVGGEKLLIYKPKLIQYE